MKLRSIALILLAGFGIAIPIALAQRSNNSPLSQPMPNHGMMRHGGMMHEMRVNSEFEYLTKMIPHHQEAIDTAKMVLAKSNRAEMKHFAQDIIQVQTTEIKQMKQWLRQWYPGQRTNVTYTPMMRELKNLQRNALDRAFLEDMTMHHMGAVMMSQMLLNHNLVKHEPVRPFAQQIATSQRQEIGQMQTWLRNWFGVAGEMPGMMHGPTLSRSQVKSQPPGDR
jgi:uncharacterized protein (DUF305 family)